MVGGTLIRTVVVDDDRVLRALARAHLEVHGGFKVVGEAADGAEGVEEVQRRRPDLVLLDLNMPGLDGFAALPRILEARPGTLVIVHSALDAPDAPLRCRALGAVGFLAKQAGLADLPERVLRVLREAPQAASLLAGTAPPPARFTVPSPHGEDAR